MYTKDELHHLVEQLPESGLATARRLLEALRLLGNDPMLRAHAAAAMDDEPTSPAEDEGAAEAWAEYQRGDMAPTSAMLSGRRLSQG